MNILLVDDQPARLLTYESILDELGLNLVRAGSGSEALQKLMQEEFAVVLLDVSMPDMDGFEVARLMHEHPRFEKTPIIFITGVNLTERDYLKGYQSGAVDYVSIPFVPEILPEQMPLLFNLFTQIDPRSERAQRGLGIGLALVRTRAQMHGGSVKAHSDGVGRGSEFVIRLPVWIDREGKCAQSKNPSAQNRPIGTLVRRRVLVPDDNADGLESMALLLEACGHEVTRATNGAQALESAERVLPEVLLLDIGMPQLDGYEVARRIRAPRWEHRPVLIALTGWGQDTDRQRSQQAGFDMHLVKPLDPDKLTELLARLPAA